MWRPLSTTIYIYIDITHAFRKWQHLTIVFKYDKRNYTCVQWLPLINTKHANNESQQFRKKPLSTLLADHCINNTLYNYNVLISYQHMLRVSNELET